MELAALSQVETAIFHIKHDGLITSQPCQGKHFEQGVVARNRCEFPCPAHFFFHRSPEALEDFWFRRSDSFFSIMLSMHAPIEFVETRGNRDPVTLPDLVGMA